MTGNRVTNQTLLDPSARFAYRGENVPATPTVNDVDSPAAVALRSPEHELTKHAVSVLAPRWTAWVLQILAEHRERGLTRNEISSELPFVPSSSATVRLQRLSALGLVTNGRRYTISDLGTATLPAQEHLAEWARTHYNNERPMSNADATEIALGQIMGKNTLDTLAVARNISEMETRNLLAAFPKATNAHLAHCVHDAHELGLLQRVERGRYVLSTAARDLEPSLTALAAWAETYAKPAQSSAPTVPSAVKSARVLPTAATLTAPPPRNVPAAAVTAGTARDVSSAPAVKFSHPPKPLDHTRAASISGAGRG